MDAGVDGGVAAADTGAAAVMEAVDVEARAVATVVVVGIQCAGDQIHRLRKRLSYADLREYWYWYVSNFPRVHGQSLSCSGAGLARHCK